MSDDPRTMLGPGEMFGAYRIERELGRGGMGAVFEATHLALRKRVAIKVMLGPALADPTMVQRFVREGESAARIRHEHIVDVTDVGAHEGLPYLVMEFLDGEALANLIDREAPLSARRVADLMLPICAALAAAHEAGVVHRDLKPDNIFLARSRRGDVVPKLVDFGISRLDAVGDDEARRLTGSAVIMGTPCYMAPEQARGAKHVDALSDQYSLGVVLFECATAQNPFLRESLFGIMSAILTEQVPRPTALYPPTEAGLDAVIARAMSRERGARFPDMRALGAALLPFATPDVARHWERDFAPSAVPAALPIDLRATERPPGAATQAPGAATQVPVAAAPSPAVATLSYGMPDPAAVVAAPTPTPARPAIPRWAIGVAVAFVGALVAALALPRPSTAPRELGAAQLPDARAQLPDARAQLPDARAQLPDARAQLPDARAQLPVAPPVVDAAPPGRSRTHRSHAAPAATTAPTTTAPATTAPTNPARPAGNSEWQIRTNF
jgi:tRNA A-37 threonylcarbamoyl transferase component Bud32